MIKKTVEGILAGILIAIGGSVYLSCARNEGYLYTVIGAFFFSVALLCICYQGYSLFTGKIGFIPEKHDKEAFSVLLWGLLGNLIGTLVCGFALAVAFPDLKDQAALLSAGKLEQEIWQTLIRAIFCGILMYLAVVIFRDKKTPLAIFFCIPVFILSGFEHSIADMFYFFLGYPTFEMKSVLFLVVVLIGNAIGGMLMPTLRLLTQGKKKEQ
jgi:formate/nitrite transporter FocA (FNT family)